MADFDLFVIGGGSGGVRAARIAATHGAKVGICEEYRYGGTCVIRGCVPKKLFVYASHFHEDFTDSASYGWNIANNGFDWQTLLQNKNQEINRLNGIYEKLLHNAGVTILNGHGKLLDANTVQINAGQINTEQADGQTISADKILIATGGTPFKPNIPGIEHSITSNEAFYLDELPKRAIVVGGGYIAVEFAGIFNGLGTDTTLVYRGEQILRGFDEDIRQHLAGEITKKGIKLALNNNIKSIELLDGDEKQVTFTDGTQQIVDCIMYATGRKPNTDNLDLAEAGVELGKKGEIIVDEESRTNISNIFAVGDVTDRIALTPVATMEGHAFADSEFGNNARLPNHTNVPSAVFSQPPVATVGLSEEQAKVQYKNIDTYRSEFRILKHTLTDNQERSFMKLIVDADSDKVIGAHMVGADAAEIMQGVAIAIKAGAKKADFDATVGIHPSSAEEWCTLRNKD